MNLSKATTEQFALVPITNGAISEWRTLYFLELLNLKAGEILDVEAEGQVRNDSGIGVELARCITITPTVSGGAEPLAGNFIAEINGINIIPGTHYGLLSKTGRYLVPADMPVAYLCLRARCRSSDATGSQAVTVNMGQGHLSALRFPPA